MTGFEGMTPQQKMLVLFIAAPMEFVRLLKEKEELEAKELKEEKMKNPKVYKIMAQRFVVNILENNPPMLDDEGVSSEDEEEIINEYNKIKERLRKVAVRNGGEFNRYTS